MGFRSDFDRNLAEIGRYRSRQWRATILAIFDRNLVGNLSGFDRALRSVGLR